MPFKFDNPNTLELLGLQVEAHLTNCILWLLGEMQVSLSGGWKSDCSTRTTPAPPSGHRLSPVTQPEERKHLAVPCADCRQATIRAEAVPGCATCRWHWTGRGSHCTRRCSTSPLACIFREAVCFRKSNRWRSYSPQDHRVHHGWIASSLVNCGWRCSTLLQHESWTIGQQWPSDIIYIAKVV